MARPLLEDFFAASPHQIIAIAIAIATQCEWIDNLHFYTLGWQEQADAWFDESDMGTGPTPFDPTDTGHIQRRAGIGLL